LLDRHGGVVGCRIVDPPVRVYSGSRG
jgi:hypothetical protein